MIYSLITTSVGNKDITLENKSKNVAFLVYKTIGYCRPKVFVNTSFNSRKEYLLWRGVSSSKDLA